MSVEPAASGDDAQIWAGSKTISLPYDSDIANAASNTNTGVPGKYVVDINGKYMLTAEDSLPYSGLILAAFYFGNWRLRSKLSFL